MIYFDKDASLGWICFNFVGPACGMISQDQEHRITTKEKKKVANTTWEWSTEAVTFYSKSLDLIKYEYGKTFWGGQGKGRVKWVLTLYPTR